MKKFFRNINEKINFILNNIKPKELLNILFMYFAFVFLFCIFYSFFHTYVISNICSLTVTLFFFLNTFIDINIEERKNQVFAFPELIGIILGFISMIPMIFNNI